MMAIEAISLSKSYGKGNARVEALKGIEFSVPPGELFGVIGPDGAGKTSLFRILTTLLLADHGEARVDGFDVVKQYREIRRRIGYMPGRFSLYQDLTVEENLEFFATIFNTSVRENYALVRDIYQQIEPFKDRPAGKLSGGMKQKLALSCALIHRPSVLFLDEPTTGVDAVSRKEFWHMLKQLQLQGITILVSTPYMDEASQCDRIALVQEGRFLSLDSPAGTIAGFGKPLWAVRSEQMYPLQQDLRQSKAVASAYPFGEYFHVTLSPDNTDPSDLRHYLEGRGHQGLEIRGIAPGIEDVFMHLMQQPHA
jgi:ABC-type multidrug transport system ATPase subunit